MHGFAVLQSHALKVAQACLPAHFRLTFPSPANLTCIQMLFAVSPVICSSLIPCSHPVAFLTLCWDPPMGSKLC